MPIDTGAVRVFVGGGMEAPCSRVFFSPVGGELRSCTVTQSGAADRFAPDRPAQDGT